ncbi:heptahelical transmembrane protein ADIPOR1-like [Ananas comosus]|uniref:Heptahelical transmembrane protein ADIPOR1-like n=1 Tax=Ananas comosus TaxID=4615 RepID=A0A6P5EIV0_ANACO|nr:heptahelical transmembrane protein ADIPOR1-like [Ananas comosus]
MESEVHEQLQLHMKDLGGLDVRNNSSSNNNKKKKKSNSKKKKPKRDDDEERNYGLVSYEELPEYMKENEYILGYYRAEWPIPNALLSLFSWHNETINIWTHLLGFFVFLGLTLLHVSYYVPQVADLLGHLPWYGSSLAVENASYNMGSFFVGAKSLSELNTVADHRSTAAAARWPFFVFLGGSMFCLLSSSACHLLCCHSRRLNVFLARLDYVGIAVMIVASFFPPIYYIFLCDPRWRLVYLSAISAMGCATVFALLSPHLSAGRFRAYRAMLFAGMGFSGVVPAVHAAVVNWGEPRRNVTMAYEVAMAAAYAVGTAFYVSRVPERWRPGRFDLAGHSHQIFHVFVIAGALAHYGAATIFLEFRDEVGCS